MRARRHRGAAESADAELPSKKTAKNHWHISREPINMKGRREEQCWALSKAVAKSRAHGNRKRRRCHDGSRCVHGSITAWHIPSSSISFRIDREEPLAQHARTDQRELL
jgi:hypothetical protein